jgi:NAD(P)H-dependent FMN reductase
MVDPPLRVAVLVGSTREGRLGSTVANWFVGEARQRDDLAVDVIDLAEAALPATPAREPSPEVARVLAAVTPRLAAADAFVVVTPEYNHSFPAALKAAIDWHRAEWRAKPVGFVSYGGRSGGLLAVEQLRAVFAELHATTIRDTVSFHRAWDEFDADGRPADPAGCGAAAKALLDELAWWGLALRDARARRPYSA